MEGHVNELAGDVNTLTNRSDINPEKGLAIDENQCTQHSQPDAEGITALISRSKILLEDEYTKTLSRRIDSLGIYIHFTVRFDG